MCCLTSYMLLYVHVGFSITPGQAEWSPTLITPLDQTRLTETLSRLYDELVAHERLCVDMVDSVIGIRLQATGGVSGAFNLDLPVTLRGIPFFRGDACVAPAAAGQKPVAEKAEATAGKADGNRPQASQP